jgi:hypothetical protein
VTKKNKKRGKRTGRGFWGSREARNNAGHAKQLTVAAGCGHKAFGSLQRPIVFHGWEGVAEQLHILLRGEGRPEKRRGS